jgi:hypothetical protein
MKYTSLKALYFDKVAEIEKLRSELEPLETDPGQADEYSALETSASELERYQAATPTIQTRGEGSFVFEWSHHGTEVFVTSTFDNWAETEKLEATALGFMKRIILPTTATEKIYYKFVVDGNWVIDHLAPQETDVYGNLNNILTPDMIELFPQSTWFNDDWAITPDDKKKFDHIYSTMDKTNKGFITGDEAVPFFSESKLPEEVLAQIWDLADINFAGRLSRDEFAVVMYLIRQ